MRIDQFVYLVEIAKFGSISLAAEHLHISQPTISLAISMLEEELGIKLFYRSRFGTKPTEDGVIVIQKAMEVLNKIEEIKEISNKNSKMLTGTVSLSVVPSFCVSLLPRVLLDFKERFPNVTVKIFEAGSYEIEKELLEGNVDLGFIATEENHRFEDKEDFVYKHLIYGQIVAYVGYKSPLAGLKKITFKEIVNHPILTFKPEYRLYEKILKIASKYGKPNILFQSGNTSAGKQIISEGIGIGFTSNLGIKYDPYFLTQRVVPIPIADENMRMSYGWLKLKNRRLPTACREFMKALEMQVHLEI